MSNMREVIQQAFLAAAANGDQWPASLDALHLDPALTASPRDLQNPALVYHPWTPDQLANTPNPDQLPVLWEQPNATTDGLSVGFADGHIEWLPNQAALDTLLEKATQPETPNDDNTADDPTTMQN
jgi:hypothetical protein